MGNTCSAKGRTAGWYTARSGSMRQRRRREWTRGACRLRCQSRPAEPRRYRRTFRPARFEVEILSEASATELVTRLHRRPWRALHLESLIDPTGGKKAIRLAAVGDGLPLARGDLPPELKSIEQLELVVIRGGARAGAGFAASGARPSATSRVQRGSGETTGIWRTRSPRYSLAASTRS